MGGARGAVRKTAQPDCGDNRSPRGPRERRHGTASELPAVITRARTDPASPGKKSDLEWWMTNISGSRELRFVQVKEPMPPNVALNADINMGRQSRRPNTTKALRGYTIQYIRRKQHNIHEPEPPGSGMTSLCPGPLATRATELLRCRGHAQVFLPTDPWRRWT